MSVSNHFYYDKLKEYDEAEASKVRTRAAAEVLRRKLGTDATATLWNEMAKTFLESNAQKYVQMAMVKGDRDMISVLAPFCQNIVNHDLSRHDHRQIHRPIYNSGRTTIAAQHTARLCQ